VKGCDLPEHVSEWVLGETSNVFEGSPFLGLVSGFLHVQDKFSDVTISFFNKSSMYQQVSFDKFVTYLWIISARSFMLGTPWNKPEIPVVRYLR
jgi:hypothetical protein